MRLSKPKAISWISHAIYGPRPGLQEINELLAKNGEMQSYIRPLL